MTHVTCMLTAKNRDQLLNPTLGNRVWAIPLPFYQLHYPFRNNWRPNHFEQSSWNCLVGPNSQWTVVILGQPVHQVWRSYSFFSSQWPTCNINFVHPATTRSTVVSVIHEVDRRRFLPTTPVHRRTDISPLGHSRLGHSRDFCSAGSTRTDQLTNQR